MTMSDLKNLIADEAFAFLSNVNGDFTVMTRDDILEVLDSPEVLEVLDKYDLSSEYSKEKNDILLIGLGVGLDIGVRYGIKLLTKYILNIATEATNEAAQNNNELSYDNYRKYLSNKDTE